MQSEATIRVAQWRRDNPAKQMLQRARRRAKLAGLACNISEADVVIPEYCPILGLKLASSRKRLTANSPSLDRIIPKLGYVVGNVQVISMKANWMKCNSTPEELIRFANWVRDEYGT